MKKGGTIYHVLMPGTRVAEGFSTTKVKTMMVGVV